MSVYSGNGDACRMMSVVESHLCLHQLFEAQVLQRPDAVACLCEDEIITYEGLNQRTDCLAFFLRQEGVGCETLVGLYVERSLDFVVGVLGILKAGGAYVPLDPAYPQERLAFMAADAAMSVILTQTRVSQRLPGGSAKVLYLDADWPCRPRTQASTAEVSADNLAYVIYTSGSTGTPKGIAVAHRGVVHNILDLNQRFAVGSGDSVLMLSALSFDMSVYEVLGVLAAGGRVVIPGRSESQNAVSWRALMQQHGITLWNSAPALLKLLVAALDEPPQVQLRSLRLALLGGDWIPLSLPDQIKALAPALQVISLGGATEASIHSIIYPIERCDPTWKSIPYGWPMANQEAYILDAQLQLSPIDVPGELHLGGVGLARGYIRCPALTAEKFIPHLLRNKTGARLYKTGDLACYRVDGTIELLGRLDHQVKMRGIRIEPGEIEAVLRQHPDIQEAVVLVKEDEREKQYLVAYITGRSALLTFSHLRRFVLRKLPEALLPAVFVPLESLPLTPNGKVDRLTLLAMPGAALRSSADFVAPGTPLEEVIAKMWSNVLGVGRVGIDDNFFELGGHSLLATQIISRLQDAFQVDVSLQTFFAAPTVSQFADMLSKDSMITRQDVHKTAQILLQLYQLSDDEVQVMLARYTGKSGEKTHEYIQAGSIRTPGN